MFPLTLPRLFSTVHCDAEKSTAASALSSVKSAMAVPESELKRWRRAFDANAKVSPGGEKFVLLLRVYDWTAVFTN